MATLADLFASSAAPNVAQLAPQRVAQVKKPGEGFRNTVGRVADILAAMGGRQMGYATGLAQNEARTQQQAQQNYLATLYADPTNEMAAQGFLEAGGDIPTVAALQKASAPATQPMGSLPREVIIARMLEDPNTSPAMKARLEGLIAPKPVAAPRERLVSTERGYLPESQAVGMMPYRAPERAAAGGGGDKAAPSTMFERRAEAIRQRLGEDAYNQFLATGKVPGASANATPGETLALIDRSKRLLPGASSGGIQAATTAIADVAGVTSKRSGADASLNAIGARLAATTPRFEGPQSDKDTAAYRASVADVGNAKLPVASRMAALREVEDIVKRNAMRRPTTAASPNAGQFKVLRSRPAQ